MPINIALLRSAAINFQSGREAQKLKEQDNEKQTILVNLPAIAALVTLAALGIVWQTQPVQATSATEAR